MRFSSAFGLTFESAGIFFHTRARCPSASLYTRTFKFLGPAMRHEKEREREIERERKFNLRASILSVESRRFHRLLILLMGNLFFMARAFIFYKRKERDGTTREENPVQRPLIKTCVCRAKVRLPKTFSSISNRDVPTSSSSYVFRSLRLPQPLRFIQPSSDCGHIVRTTPHLLLLLPLDEIFARLPGDGRNREMNVRARWGRNSFRVSSCYFYEHLANTYPLLSFVSIFIFP